MTLVATTRPTWAVLITKLMFRPLLAVGIILATITSSAAQLCPAGAPMTTNCACPWGTHVGGSWNNSQYSTVPCGYPCPICVQNDLPRPNPPDDSASKPPSPAPQLESRQGRLGVKFRVVDQNSAFKLGLRTTRGALVVGLVAGGPAARAGIRMGDVIVQFNGDDVVESSDLPGLVSAVTIGQEVPVVVIRNGEKLSFSSSVADIDSDQASAFEQGSRDRTDWEKWVSGLEGDAREGALFWAGERNARPAQSLPSCSDGQGQTSDAFRRACVSARLFLTAVDSRLYTESEYKNGWNSY